MGETREGTPVPCVEVAEAEEEAWRGLDLKSGSFTPEAGVGQPCAAVGKTVERPRDSQGLPGGETLSEQRLTQIHT